MALSKNETEGLGVAFNEATLLGVEVDAARSLCGLTLSVLTLPQDGPAPDDSRVQMLLRPVGRVCASLRSGRWDDLQAHVEKFELSELLKIVQSFGGQPIYGWKFFDLEEFNFEEWSDRLSLDWHGNSSAMEHNITLFQEGSVPERILDLRIWFKEITFHRANGELIKTEDIITGGKKWWDGLHSGDKRTAGHGIFPGKP